MADDPPELRPLFSLRAGQSGDPPAIGYAPSAGGRAPRLIVGGGDGRVRAYDVSTGCKAPPLAWASPRHQGAWITDLAVFPGSSRVVTAGRDGSLWLWSLKDGAHLGCFRGHREWVFAIAASPDGTRVASVGDDGCLRIWRLGSPEPILSLDIPTGDDVLVEEARALGDGPPTGLYSVDWSPDGAWLAIGDFEGSVTLIEAWSGALRWRRKGIDDIPWSLAFSPDGERLALGGGSPRVGCYATATGDMSILPYRGPGSLPGVDWLGNRHLVAGGEGGRLVVQGVDGALIAEGAFPEGSLWRLKALGDTGLLVTTHPGDLCRGWRWKDTLMLPKGASPQ